MNEEFEQSQNVASYRKAMNEYNLLKIRLDTTEIINQAKMYLTAEIEMIDQDKEGNLQRKVVHTGDAKANKEGINSILTWLQMTINPQVVQGNFQADSKGQSMRYDNYIYWFRIDFMDYLMINLYKFNIDEDEIQGIVDSICLLVEPFMTRLIGNKERESYGETFKEITSNVSRDSRRFPGLTQ